MGRAIEHRNQRGPGCRGFSQRRRQHSTHRYGKGGRNPAVSKNPCMHARTHCTGTWEVSMPSRCRGGIAKERHSPYPMKDGLEKSDSVISAVKSANKGTSVPAEPMERRTEPKGNLESQSTRRAQDRESVTQAADRIRRFVQRDPRVRLTTLLHHVTVDALRWAFFELKRNASAGADGSVVGLITITHRGWVRLHDHRRSLTSVPVARARTCPRKLQCASASMSAISHDMPAAMKSRKKRPSPPKASKPISMNASPI